LTFATSSSFTLTHPAKLEGEGAGAEVLDDKD
jgi:hypothetical protein